MLLSYNWQKALAGTDLQLRLVGVWVCLPSLDTVLERNRKRLESGPTQMTASMLDQQLTPLRSQATSDTEWALTSGSFDFTVVNEDIDKATAELIKASKYCFSDPF